MHAQSVSLVELVDAPLLLLPLWSAREAPHAGLRAAACAPGSANCLEAAAHTKRRHVCAHAQVLHRVRGRDAAAATRCCRRHLRGAVSSCSSAQRVVVAARSVPLPCFILTGALLGLATPQLLPHDPSWPVPSTAARAAQVEAGCRPRRAPRTPAASAPCKLHQVRSAAPRGAAAGRGAGATCGAAAGGGVAWRAERSGARAELGGRATSCSMSRLVGGCWAAGRHAAGAWP